MARRLKHFFAAQGLPPRPVRPVAMRVLPPMEYDKKELAQCSPFITYQTKQTLRNLRS